ncbi:FkbM family methyltransferase [Brevibacillus sp. H7]|uniref:FkbM family methyltransferase n=1 Tax=Brevibacillus sp. H7 TaxID=3349138 RepID=UPI00380AA866
MNKSSEDWKKCESMLRMLVKVQHFSENHEKNLVNSARKGEVVTIYSKLGPIILSSMDLITDLKVALDIFQSNDYLTNFVDACVVDIGAHKGYFGMYAFLNGASSVVSYEPENENYKVLSQVNQHFLQNETRIWKIFNKGVIDQEKKQSFYVYDQSWSHSILKRQDKTLVSKIKVQMTSMENVINEIISLNRQEKKRVIVKIDAEGSECQIVFNTPSCCWEHIDELFIEYHRYALCTRDALAEQVMQLGFQLHNINHNLFHFIRVS